MAETVEFVSVDDYSGSTKTTTNISNGTLCKVISMRNRGIPDTQWAIEGSTSSFGGRLQAMRLEPRRIQLDLFWQTTTASLAVTRREALYGLFKPFDVNWFSSLPTNPVGNSLKITRADGSIRQIDCQVEGAMDLPYDGTDDFSDDSFSGKIRVTLLCADPVWYNPTATEYLDTGFSGSFSGLHSLGDSGPTWFMYPIIYLSGPTTTVTFSNNAGGAFAFTNAVGSGETITIDCRPFKKTIVDQTGDARYDLLNGYSSAFTEFFIPPQWFYSSSRFAYSGTGATGSTTIEISYHKKYIGV